MSGSYSSFVAPAVKKKIKECWYVNFARKAGTVFKAKNEFTNEKYKLALEFLDWKLEPREVNAAPLLGMLISIVFVLPLIAVIGYSVFFGVPLPIINIELPLMFGIYAILPLFIVPFFAVYYFQNYIISAANAEKMKAITSIPEIVNYLVMSMKLSPNLEKALEFASEHGRGKIAEDMKRMVWNSKVGAYGSIEEALDEFAYRWGNYSDDFKHALMLIRSSVIEVDEAKRNLMLDKAVTETLEGMREKMSKYAIEMKQPSIYLYYIGVLLPLMMIIMLPIGSVMAKIPLADTRLMILLYNIAIPIGSVLFTRTILSKRPPIYLPPVIPDDFPGLPKKGHVRIGKSEVPVLFVSIAAALAVFFLFYFIADPLLNPVPPSYATEEVKASYYPFFGIAGGVMGASVFASVYLYYSVYYKRKAQIRIMRMENEFQDSIYIIASRLGENRPIEEAIAYTGMFLPKSETAEFFKRTNDNVSNLGMTVEAALFDPIYGSLKNVPSTTIRGAMRIVIDSISLGVQQAARALISLSLQLRDARKVKEEIRTMLEEITSMMKSIAFLIAPLVLGITTALNKIVLDALKAMGQQTIQQPEMPSSINMPINMPFTSFGDPALLENVPGPFLFLIIISIYVIQITLILIYFTSKIEEGDNDIALKSSIAKSLPIALAIFFLSAWFASSFNIG